MGNILIVAPHPDDETLGCGGVIAKKSRAGDRVHVVVLSDGSRLFTAAFGIETNPTPQEVSRRRKQETERAVEILGGRTADIRYLDYPDGSLDAHAEEIARELLAIIEELAPSEVYVTSAQEQHPDHRAANGIVQAALARSPRRPVLLQYAVAPCPEPAEDGRQGRRVEVDIADSYELKKRAIDQFECHLACLSPLQPGPLWRDGSQYLHRTETFLVRQEAPAATPPG